MDSRTYWSLREEEALKRYIKDEKEYDRQIERIYRDMLDSVQEQINGFYGRYADKEGITLAEAKKRVKQADIAAYERKAARYVKDKDFSRQANEEMRLYNLTMKVNRLEMLKANIGLELIAGHDELDKFMGDILRGRTMDELQRQAGILGKTVRNNARTAHAIVNGSYRVASVGGKSTFSDYIWLYQDQMRENLGGLLQTGLIQGKNPRAIAKDLKKYWYGKDPKTKGGAVYCMERLMRTELARVQTDAQKQSFERNGYDKYIFIPNVGCCAHCTDAANKDTGYSEKGVYLVKDMMPGSNAAPMHPHCRCSTAAWEDSDEYNAWLEQLAKGDAKADAERQERIKARRAAYRERRSASPDFETMSRQELEQYAANGLKTNIVGISGTNSDFLRETVKTLYVFEKKNGGAISGLTVKFGETERGQYAAFRAETKTIYLKKTGSISKFEEAQAAANARYRAKWKKNKDYHATTTFSGTIFHELGHAVDYDTGYALSKTLGNNSELYTKALAVSSYAGASGGIGAPKASEAWAENFAAYMDGANAAKVPIEVVQMIEEYFKE